MGSIDIWADHWWDCFKVWLQSSGYSNGSDYAICFKLIAISEAISEPQPTEI